MRARSAAEIAKWFDHHACERCGTFTPERDMELTSSRLPDGGGVREYSVTCRGCNELRRVRIEVPPRWPRLDGNAIGGPEPSQLFSPDELLALADRMVAGIPADPAGLAPVVYFQLDNRIVDAVMFVEEILKFIPADADAVPDAAPAERYQRAALVAHAASLRRLRERYLAHLPQMKARSRRITPGPPVVAAGSQTVSQQELEAHRRWLARGSSGKGRLVLESASLAGMKLAGVRLGGASLTRVDLDLATLENANLAGAELTECTARGANLANATLDAATLTGCRFDGAFLILCDLIGVTIAGGSFRDAAADRARWNDARIHRASFRDAQLGDSVLDGALFEDCDLRKIDLAHVTEALRDVCTTFGTSFVRCDLRGANFAGRCLDCTRFIDCKLAGITGVPIVESPCVVTGADFTGADGAIDRDTAAAVEAWTR